MVARADGTIIRLFNDARPHIDAFQQLQMPQQRESRIASFVHQESSPLLRSHSHRDEITGRRRTGSSASSFKPPTSLDKLRYYLPLTDWLASYSRQFLIKDAIAGLTMACVVIPMSLSYASNLAKVDPINGLYASVSAPIVYALMGSSPQLIVLPEAPLSLLIGEAIRRQIVHSDHSNETNIIASFVTFLCGALLLAGGLFRLGFLDSLLSRPLLRGFISGVACVIFCDQLITQLGLHRLAEAKGAMNASPIMKFWFCLTHIEHSTTLSVIVAAVSFIILIMARVTKKSLQARHNWIIYVPEILIVVVISCIFSYYFHWDEKGLAVLGDVKVSHGHVRFPVPYHISHAWDSISTAFIICVLGLFESTVAIKGLPMRETSTGTPSMNREMVALGAVNILGSFFPTLPCFGGYGRSMVNLLSGAQTQMAGVFMSLIVLLSIFVLLPYFYFLPKAILASIISVVAVLLLSEAPEDIVFYWKVGGWQELTLMGIVLLLTIFWSEFPIWSVIVALTCRP